MIKIPNPQNQNPFSIPNNSDKNGNIWYTKNISFDELGYIKNSHRTVQICDEAGNNNFDVPVSLNRYSSGSYQVITTDNAFNVGLSSTFSITTTENSGTNEPNGTINSHGVAWQGRIHASESTSVVSKAIDGSASATWTDRITSLTAGVRHFLEIFVNRLSICVTNGNVIKQYDTSYSGTTDLTIPSDFEAVGLAYNDNQMGVITRFSAATEGQNKEAYFFLWNGSDTSASGGWGVGSEACIAICAYKSSFLILTKAGQLKYFNGGGFEDLASFPFYFSDVIYGDFLNQKGRGSLMWVDGDVVYINLSTAIGTYNKNRERQLQNCPSGLWCFDPMVGLYHRYSPSSSQAYGFQVTDSNVDTTTNIFTVSSGTVPQTGSIARYLSATTVLGGLELNEDYYVIKTSSSTFKLAETKADAIAGTAIDITSKGSGTNGFWMFDIVDYGQTFTGEAGAVTTTGELSMKSGDILFGSDLYDSSLSDNANLSLSIPYLESRGYFITPKIFSQQITNNEQKLFVKYNPLRSSDSIVVSSRIKKLKGLPVTTPQALLGATWSNSQTFYTTANLSDALTAYQNNKELELEVIAGIGAGVCTKIVEIRLQDSQYVVTVEDEVVGVTEGAQSYFIIDHWVRKTIITSDTVTNEMGYAEVPVGDIGSWIQFKIELIGVDVTIEELQIVNETSKKSA